MQQKTFSVEQAKLICEKQYGLQCIDAKQLGGYVDKHFWIKDHRQKEFILRITFPENFIGEDVADEIDAVKQHLLENGFKVPHLIKAKNECNRLFYAKDSEVIDLSGIRIQLSDFIQGRTIQESELTFRELQEISFEVGQLLGLMNKCLTTYLCKKTTSFWGKDFFWYTDQFCQAKRLVKYVRDMEIKSIFNEILEQFDDTVHPLLPTLRYGFVQGDPSSTNVVIVQQSNFKPSCEISVKEKLGMIDFDHCHYGPLVFELSVCIAYMMTSANNSEKDALLISKNVLSGYEKIFPLIENEKKVLYHGIMARLISSYAMACYQVSLHPENKDYITIVSRKCPFLLRLLKKKGEYQTMKYWFNQDD